MVVSLSLQDHCEVMACRNRGAIRAGNCVVYALRRRLPGMGRNLGTGLKRSGHNLAGVAFPAVLEVAGPCLNLGIVDLGENLIEGIIR